jgi:hypothetical protein
MELTRLSFVRILRLGKERGEQHSKAELPVNIPPALLPSRRRDETPKYIACLQLLFPDEVDF